MSSGQNSNKISRRTFLIAAGGLAAAAALGGALWAAGSTQQSALQQTAAQQRSVKLSILARSGYHANVNGALFEYAKSKMPNVEVEYDGKGYADTYKVAVLSMRQRSDRYDVLYLDEPWLHIFYVNNWLAPLGGYDTSGIPDLIVQTGVYRGEVYAIPTTGNFNFLFYNRRIIRDVGETEPRSWDDVLRIAETVTARLGGGGVYGWSSYYPSVFTDAFLTILASLGGRVFDPRDKVTPVLDSQEAVEALKILKTLADRRRGHPKSLTWATLEEYSDAIYKGEVAMGMVWNGWVSLADDPQRSRVVGEIEVVPAPGRYRVTQTGIWYWTVAATSRNRDVAVQFVKEITTYEAQKYSYLKAGLPVVRATLFRDPEVRQRDRLADSWAKIMEAAVPLRTSPVFMEMEQSLDTIFQKAIIGEISPEEAVKQAHKTLVEASKKAGLI
ncbi:MAG: extracellular solute-binding protein [Pyrobaculum sp.]